MNKGDVVKCVESKALGDFIAGNEYTILAGEGDKDEVIGGLVGDIGMVLRTEDGYLAYCLFPECSFGSWELVQ